MKYTKLFYGIIAVFLAACSATTDTELGSLKARYAALKKEYDKVGAELHELEKQIAKLDTTKKLTLITTLAVQQRDFKHFFEVQGNVATDQNITMYPESGGTVTRIMVKEGQEVKKGALLLELDASVLLQNIKEVETALELAETVYKRQAVLWEQKIGSELQYLEAKNKKESLETNLATLEAQLQKLRITAPFSGVIDEIFPKIGELTAPSTPLLRLINLDNMYIEADVSESYIGIVKKGTAVAVDFPNSADQGNYQVSRTGNFINPNNRSFKIQVDLSNAQAAVKPNQLALLHIEDFFVADGLTVPNRVILEGPDGRSFVYTSNTDKGEAVVHKVFVETGPSYQDQTLITAGLNAGDLIVDKGSRSVKDTQKVSVLQ